MDGSNQPPTVSPIVAVAVAVADGGGDCDALVRSVMCLLVWCCLLTVRTRVLYSTLEYYYVQAQTMVGVTNQVLVPVAGIPVVGWLVGWLVRWLIHF